MFSLLSVVPLFALIIQKFNATLARRNEQAFLGWGWQLGFRAAERIARVLEWNTQCACSNICLQITDNQ